MAAVIKIMCDDETRLLTLAASSVPPTFTDVLAGALALFGKSAGRLVYTDADGDGVTVHNDASLAFFLGGSASGGKTPKLHLIVAATPAPAAAAAAAAPTAVAAASAACTEPSTPKAAGGKGGKGAGKGGDAGAAGAALRELHAQFAAEREAAKAEIAAVAEAALKQHAHMVGHTRKVNAQVRGMVKEAKSQLKEVQTALEADVRAGKSAVSGALDTLRTLLTPVSTTATARITAAVNASLDEHFRAQVAGALASSSGASSGSDGDAGVVSASTVPKAKSKAAVAAAAAADAASASVLTAPFSLTDAALARLVAQLQAYARDADVVTAAMAAAATTPVLGMLPRVFMDVALGSSTALAAVRAVVTAQPLAVLQAVEAFLRAAPRVRVEMGADIVVALRACGYAETAIDAMMVAAA